MDLYTSENEELGVNMKNILFWPLLWDKQWKQKLITLFAEEAEHQGQINSSPVPQLTAPSMLNR